MRGQKDKMYHKGFKMKNILTVEDVAKKIQMSKSTIYKHAENNKIPSFKIGSCRRFFENEIDEYLIAMAKEQREMQVSSSTAKEK